MHKLVGGTKKKISNETLLLQIETVPEPMRREAWDELLTRDREQGLLHNLCFCDVVARAPSPYRDKAWEMLSERNVKGIDLCYIIKRANGPKNPYEMKAWKLLCAMEHEDGYCFRYLIDYAPSFKNRAFDEFLKRGFPLAELKNLTKHVRESAFWKEKIEPLFAKKPG